VMHFHSVSLRRVVQRQVHGESRHRERQSAQRPAQRVVATRERHAQTDNAAADAAHRNRHAKDRHEEYQIAGQLRLNCDENSVPPYRHGEIAEAKPAVPGWRVSVDWVFS
jgi:hypothetical protein